MAAHNTTSATTSCECDCYDGLGGETCDNIEPGCIHRDLGFTFWGKSNGASGWPRFGRSYEIHCCDVAQDCNGRGLGVYDIEHNECACHCKHHWSGNDCSTCPEGYDPAQDCNACISGWVNAGTGGVVQCRQCSATKDCSNHGYVTGFDPSSQRCMCYCEAPWRGSRCDACDQTLYTSDCLSCLPGRINYPTCEKCSSATHCSGHASNVYVTQVPASCLQ
eukprot:gene13212-18665_t